MKNLTTFMAEGLLDSDFDAPDFNFEPIIPNIPAFIDDGEDWRDHIDKLNVRLIPYTYYTQINGIIDAAQNIVSGIQRNNVNISDMGKIGPALVALTKCDHVGFNEDLLQNVKDARALNDWIAKANKTPEFKKLVSGLGGYFYSSLSERTVRNGKIYGLLTYTLTSPNENAQLQLIKVAEKLSKINPAIKCTFAMNGEGDGVFHVKLTQHAK